MTIKYTNWGNTIEKIMKESKKEERYIKKTQ